MSPVYFPYYYRLRLSESQSLRVDSGFKNQCFHNNVSVEKRIFIPPEPLFVTCDTFFEEKIAAAAAAAVESG